MEQKPKIFVDSFYTLRDTFTEAFPNSEVVFHRTFTQNDSELGLYIKHTVDT